MAVQNILHNDVKTDRHLYLGGSDIGVIMGVSPFKTPFKLWCEKTQKIQVENLEEKEHVRMGNILEHVIAQMFAEKEKVQVRRSPVDYTHKDYSFMKAHVDRLITGTDEGLECKNTGEYNYKNWKGSDIPETYILQCQWYMGITGRKKWHIAVLIGGTKFRSKPIDFDAELFDMLVEKACEFWDMVQNNIPPELTAEDDETMKSLYPSVDSPDYIELYTTDDERANQAANSLQESIAMLQETKTHIKELEKEQKEIETKLKDLIKSNTGIKTDKYVVSWKSQSKKGIDTKALQEEMPQVAEKFTTESSFRVLRITNNKEREVA